MSTQKVIWSDRVIEEIKILWKKMLYVKYAVQLNDLSVKVLFFFLEDGIYFNSSTTCENSFSQKKFLKQ